METAKPKNVKVLWSIKPAGIMRPVAARRIYVLVALNTHKHCDKSEIQTLPGQEWQNNSSRSPTAYKFGKNFNTMWARSGFLSWVLCLRSVKAKKHE